MDTVVLQDAIIVKGLKKNFGPTEALRGINLEVPEGQIFGLVGPDGAGKTTLIKILAGIYAFDSGEASIMGRDLRRNLDDIRNHIGYVSQKFNLYGDLTVEENINFFASLYPTTGNEEKHKKEMLDFIGLSQFNKRLAANLSGGMKQKLSLLCSLIHNPSLLLMDEPTTGVDPVSRREFWGIIFDLQKRGLTVVASTPYMDEAEQFDRVALIDRGEFFRIGTAAEIRTSIPGAVLEIICSEPVRARAALRGLQAVKDVELFGDKIHVFVDAASDEVRADIIRVMQEAKIEVKKAMFVPYSIEDVFLRVTQF